MWEIIDKRCVYNDPNPPPQGWNIWGQRTGQAGPGDNVVAIITRVIADYKQVIQRNGRFMENGPRRMEFIEARRNSRWPIPEINTDEERMLWEVARGENFVEDVLETKAVERRVAMPAFKHDYDTVEEARRRLLQTIVMIQGIPYLVEDVRQNMRHGIYLTLDPTTGDKKKVPLNKIHDLRSPPPGYLSFKDDELFGTFWFARKPARVTMQGLPMRERGGTGYVKAVGNERGFQPWPRAGILIKGLLNKDNMKFQPAMGEFMVSGLIKNIRLNGNVACYAEGNAAFVEYKGRKLGKLQGNRVSLEDETDRNVPWIEKDLNSANIEVER